MYLKPKAEKPSNPGMQELESRLAETEASASAFEARRRSAAVSTSRLREGLASLWQVRPQCW